MDKQKFKEEASKLGSVLLRAVKTFASKTKQAAVDGRSDTQAQIALESMNRYEEIQGGSIDRFPDPNRELFDVDESEAEMVLQMGAVYDPIKCTFIVPPDIDYQEFSMWWPEKPDDLKTPYKRQLLTKSGWTKESYVHPEDEERGGDSLALPIMFGALVVLSVLAFGAIKLFGSDSFVGALFQKKEGLKFSSLIGFFVAFLLTLATIPYLIAIGQSEGAKESFKTFVLLFLIPLALSVNLNLPKPQNPSLSSGILIELVASIVLFLIYAKITGLYVLFFGASASDAHQTGGYKRALGTKFDQYRGFLKFGLLVLALTIFTKLIPGFFAQHKIPYLQHLVHFNPLMYYALACLYPLYYCQNDVMLRLQILATQASKFNLGLKGSLATVGEVARNAQMKAAYNDKSDKLTVGIAQGVLEKKMYSFAPSMGVRLIMSVVDASKHMIIFGGTGSGKTASMIRPWITQVRKYKKYGLLILDGKCVLASEVRKYIDLMVEPGVRFAPFQGLNAEQVFTSLTDNKNTKKGDQKAKDDGSVWVGGAHDLCKYSLSILEAVIESEKTAYAAYLNEYMIFDEKLMALEIQMEIESREGEVAFETQAEYDNTVSNLADLKEALISQRNFYWTPWSLQKMRRIITKVDFGKGGMVNGERVNAASKDMLQIGRSLGLKIEANEEGRAEVIYGDYEPFAHSEVLREGSPLNAALAYAITDYPTFGSNYTTAFEQNFNRLINPLMEGKKLCEYIKDEKGNMVPGTPWHMIEEGLDVSTVLTDAKSCGINLPETQFGVAAILIQSLVKSRVYNGIRMRDADYIKKGGNPVFAFIDECQEIVGDDERSLAPISRSLGLYIVSATQNFSSLVEAMGNQNSATLFADTHQSLVCFRGSADTYQYITQRVGKAMLTNFVENNAGIDYEGAVTTASDSIYNNMEHPNVVGIQQLDRLGAGNLTALRYHGGNVDWMGNKAQKLGGEGLMNGIQVPCGGKREIQDIIKPEDLMTYLNVQGFGFVHLDRAGTKIADIAKFDHLDACDIDREVA